MTDSTTHIRVWLADQHPGVYSAPPSEWREPNDWATATDLLLTTEDAFRVTCLPENVGRWVLVHDLASGRLLVVGPSNGGLLAVVDDELGSEQLAHQRARVSAAVSVEGSPTEIELFGSDATLVSNLSPGESIQVVDLRTIRVLRVTRQLNDAPLITVDHAATAHLAERLAQ